MRNAVVLLVADVKLLLLFIFMNVLMLAVFTHKCWVYLHIFSALLSELFAGVLSTVKGQRAPPEHVGTICSIQTYFCTVYAIL